MCVVHRQWAVSVEQKSKERTGCLQKLPKVFFIFDKIFVCTSKKILVKNQEIKNCMCYIFYFKIKSCNTCTHLVYTHWSFTSCVMCSFAHTSSSFSRACLLPALFLFLQRLEFVSMDSICNGILCTSTTIESLASPHQWQMCQHPIKRSNW